MNVSSITRALAEWIKALRHPSRFYRIVTGPDGEVVSEPAGFYRLGLNPGANALSVPLGKLAPALGLVVSVTGNTVTVNGNPNWPVNAFDPTNNFSQYILMVLNDASATIGSAGIQGDWWPVLSNTANTVTVNPGSDNLASILASGSSFAIRKLMSIKDLFGYGTSLILNKDCDFLSLGNYPKCDVIRFVAGTSFGMPIFYHDGTLAPAGYYLGGLGPLVHDHRVAGARIHALPPGECGPYDPPHNRWS